MAEDAKDEAPAEAIDLRASQSAMYKALVRVATESRRAGKAAGLDRRLIELVNIRVSQLNGCARCLDVHVAAALEAGETTQRLGVLTAWRESELFSTREAAALELAEAFATLPRHDLLDVQRRVAGVLDEAERSAVLSVVVAISAFNQITIAQMLPVPER